MRTIVVGASSGLGRCIAVGLAERGARVALLARRRGRLDDAVKEAGPDALAFECDVTETASCRTAIDAGYSLNDQGHQIESSPVVELLAAWGLEHARPDEFATRRARYAIWGSPLAPMLARAALCGSVITVPCQRFVFRLDLSGKNKVVTFAEREASP